MVTDVGFAILVRWRYDHIASDNTGQPSRPLALIEDIQWNLQNSGWQYRGGSNLDSESGTGPQLKAFSVTTSKSFLLNLPMSRSIRRTLKQCSEYRRATSELCSTTGATTVRDG